MIFFIFYTNISFWILEVQLAHQIRPTLEDLEVLRENFANYMQTKFDLDVHA